MASSNIKLFDENKGNMLSDSEFSISNQRMNGLQTGVASSQLQNKAMYQASLIAYAIAQVMMQNGKNANDTDAVSAFVANLSGTMLQKVYDIATTAEAQAGVATGKWMSPALVKAAIDTLAAKAQNILSDETKALYGLGTDAVPDDALALLSRFQKGLGNEYIWEKTTIEKVQAYDEMIKTNLQIGISNTVFFANSFHVEGTQFVLDSPTSSLNFTVDNVKANLGKYAMFGSNPYSEYMYKFPQDASVTQSGTTVSVSKYTYFSNPRIETITTDYGYVNSPDHNAYPPAVSDGYTYTALGQVGSCAHIETGTYVGTGNNACSIQYERTPKFVAIFSKTTTNSSDEIPFAFFMPGIGVGVYTRPSGSQNSYCNKVSCYLKDNAFKTSEHYMDISGRTYQYIMLS